MISFSPRSFWMLIPLTSLLSVMNVNAATIAWWRFDNDGFSEGQSPPQQEDVIKDETGANPACTKQTPTYTNNVPFEKFTYGSPGVVSGKKDALLMNELSLQMNNPQKWEDIFITKKPICSIYLPTYTIEVSFCCTDIAMFRAILCKDGQPTELPNSPFVIKLSPHAQKLLVETLDESGQWCGLSSKNAIEPGIWYSVAVVNNGEQLELYLKSENDGEYELQAITSVKGGMIDSSANWAIGRGMSNGELVDPFYGLVDEIRISDVALSPDDFLSGTDR